MPQFVDVFVIIALFFSVFLGRDYHGHILLYCEIHYFVCIVTTVGQEHLGYEPRY